MAAQLVQGAPIACRHALVVLADENQQWRAERAQVEHAGQIDQSAAADDGKNVMVAQGGNAQRHRRTVTRGAEADRQRRQFTQQHPLLEQCERVEQAPGEQRDVVVNVGEAFFGMRQQVERQRADAGVLKDRGESVVARFGILAGMRQHDQGRQARRQGQQALQ
ncbi:MAG: hypothetical protein CAPSK01_001937 [Candidatus Accumulibacter vicinus]|uniref:Uncharacterized protein n=1 Tax=Candidatus Accumulibacter vicinus TaxID=2954382 RepID=A0A084Y1E7_9PROT|nr:MAG: hypothetical protein CAPSK01_001937 [Candidatus Accumulibacter vicinus]